MALRVFELSRKPDFADAAVVYVVPLSECGDDTGSVGGKGAGLSRLIAAGFHVPPGFIVTTAAFRAVTEHLDQQFGAIVAEADSLSPMQWPPSRSTRC